MADESPKNPFDEVEVSLQDIILSNSWALQAILQYLDEIQPGARDRIWQHYVQMRDVAEKTKKPSGDAMEEDNEESTETEGDVRLN